MRRLFFALMLALPLACSAQQPDIRLQVMSLHRIHRATLTPLDGARIRWCARCGWQAWKQRVQVSGSSSKVEAGEGRSAETIWISGGVRFEAEGVPSRTMRTPLEIHSKAGALIFIETLPVEKYVAAVVQGETAGDMPPEALRAVAVAARTYATHFRERHKTERFDFCDTTHCQFVKSEITPDVAAAVQQTEGELLWDRGKPLAAYYHQDCGGKTEAAVNVWPGAKQSGIAAQSDPYCLRVAKSWRSDIPQRALDAALRRSGLQVPRGWNRLTITQRSPSGRVQTLLIGVGNSETGIPVAASSLRFAVGRAMGWSLLKSDLYDVTSAGDRFVFTGRGTGHGVGLCQVGAAEMARMGKSYREILAFYYPGATVSVAAGGIPWRKIPSSRLDVQVLDTNSAGVLEIAPRALGWAESQTGIQSRKRPVIYIYPSVQMFRDATGEPGWVAASTKGSSIRMQPPQILGPRLESVLRHEFLHFLLEANAAPRTPIWFREGIVMLLSGDAVNGAPLLSPEQMEEILQKRSDNSATQRAYASSVATVARLEQLYGRAELLRWLTSGIPSGVLSGRGVAQKATNQR